MDSPHRRGRPQVTCRHRRTTGGQIRSSVGVVDSSTVRWYRTTSDIVRDGPAGSRRSEPHTIRSHPSTNGLFSDRRPMNPTARCQSSPGRSTRSGPWLFVCSSHHNGDVPSRVPVFGGQGHNRRMSVNGSVRWYRTKGLAAATNRKTPTGDACRGILGRLFPVINVYIQCESNGILCPTVHAAQFCSMLSNSLSVGLANGEC
jgi:hypothetical protein